MVHTGSRKHSEFVILPPSRHSVPEVFGRVEVNRRRYDSLLVEMQRLRGRVYLEDGAVQPRDLTSDGRHQVSIDDHSWHVLSLNRDGTVCACLRYLEENRGGFDDLWVRHAAITRSAHGRMFRQAVEWEMSAARQMRMGFGEVGGWAVAEERRGTFEPLLIILATYGLLELLGSCMGVATATFRHSSATILRRIGLCSLSIGGGELPPYYDPHYRCQMEVLRFDSRFPSEKYRPWVSELRSSLMNAPVICRESFRDTLHHVFHGFEAPLPDPAALPELVSVA